MASAHQTSEQVLGRSALPQPSRVPQIPTHTGIFRLHLQAEATLNSQCVQDSVKLPKGTNKKAWIAAQLIGVINDMNTLINGALDLRCTCPVLSAGKHVTYSWADASAPEPVKLPAREYMEKLSVYAERFVSDLGDGELPANFSDEVCLILKRMFRGYAHVYLHHFPEIQGSGIEAHVNYMFKRYMYFVKEFDLVSPNDMQPLEHLMQQFLQADAARRK